MWYTRIMTTIYTEKKLREVVPHCFSMAQVLKAFGKSPSGGLLSHLRKRINQYNIDTSHFLGQGWSKGKVSTHRKSAEEILKIYPEGSYRVDAYKLRRAMIESAIEYECSDCKNSGTWNEKQLTLEVDHIDGNWLDSRLSNVQFLCPNCHSQRPNHSRNKKFLFDDIVTAKSCKCGGDVVSGMKCATCIILKPSSVKLCKCGNTKDAKAKACMSCYNSVRNQIPKKSKIDWPSTQELLDRVKATSYTQVGKELGVSDNAVRKRIKNHPIV